METMLGSYFLKFSQFTSVKAKQTRGRSPIAALLIDVSGNLHVDGTPTPGAIQALGKLVAAGIPFRLCSNTSKESTADLVRKLDHLGFGVSAMQHALSETKVSDKETTLSPRLVWTSIGAVATMLNGIESRKPYLLLSDSARAEVLSSLEQTSDRQCDAEKFDSVVVGLTPSQFDYEHLNTAFRILKGELYPSESTSTKPHLIATHRAKYIQAGDGKLSMGPGPFVAALETAADVQARVVGKPEAAFFEMVIKDFGDLRAAKKHNSMSSNIEPRIVVIGDDVEADLGGGAVELGLWRVLVRTGKYREGDECRQNGNPPDEVHDSFAAFVESLLESSS